MHEVALGAPSGARSDNRAEQRTRQAIGYCRHQPADIAALPGWFLTQYALDRSPVDLRWSDMNPISAAGAVAGLLAGAAIWGYGPNVARGGRRYGANRLPVAD
jgi:hypothetical protein